MAKEYYQTLGLQPGASVKDIRAAYRRLARTYHPDLNPHDKQAETKFKEINEAYQVLSNPEKRKQYNQFGFRTQRPTARGSHSGPSAFSWFDMARRRSSKQPGVGFEAVFDDLLKGTPRPNSHTKQNTPSGENVKISLEEALIGTSKYIAVKSLGRSVEAKIPRGVKNGELVRVRVLGAPDLTLRIELIKHELFETRGADLVYMAEVNLVDAVLGSEIIVPTLGGKSIALNVPAETQNGRFFRLRGKGMPKGIRSNDDARGDLLIKVHVVLPDRLNDQQREMFEDLRKSLAASEEE